MSTTRTSDLLSGLEELIRPDCVLVVTRRFREFFSEFARLVRLDRQHGPSGRGDFEDWHREVRRDPPPDCSPHGSANLRPLLVEAQG